MGGLILREQEAGPCLSGPDTRLITGQDLQERQTSESMLFDMESGQGESESTDTYQGDTLRRIYRDVLIGGVFDLGLGDSHEVNSVARWMRSDSFIVCCEIACWDDCWIMDLFKSVARLSSSVRKPISKQCIDMLKSLAKLDEDTSRQSVSNHINSITNTNAKHHGTPSDKIESGHSEGLFEVFKKSRKTDLASSPKLP
jgi:hypothetical protein